VMNQYDADDELQDGPLTEPEPLRDLIVAQGMQETGIFVLLFTSDTAAADGGALLDDRAAVHDDGAAVREDGAAGLVARKAAELGIDTTRLTLFSDDAYLLQAALGEALAPENA
jgi:hypothetical protein